MFSMNPIGYVHSIFTYKNGTPRQPSLCPYARGKLMIEKTVFNNPEHSLEDLEAFSHVWLIFVFHKNNNEFTKAKVKPPRLNGKKVGVFSTRSPYRPNPIGLTLAKLDKIEGSTLHLSGIDLLDGTPVLDIKPYIPSYDVPEINSVSSDENSELQKNTSVDPVDKSELNVVQNTELEIKSTNISADEIINTETNSLVECVAGNLKGDHFIDDNDISPKAEIQSSNLQQSSTENYFSDDTVLNMLNNRTNCQTQLYFDTKKIVCEINHETDKGMGIKTDTSMEECSNPRTKTADWIHSPPIDKLSARFTNYAMDQLNNFSSSSPNEDFRLKYLKSSKEVFQAVFDILCQDPRSVYRRKHCIDNLYYFVVDVVHVTAWFDGNNAEVVRLQPVSLVQHCQKT